MKITAIGEPKVIMSNFGSKHNYFAWPTVARLKNGMIVAAASGYRLRHVCPFGKSVLSYSFDEGETYTPPAPVIDTVLDDRDAGLCPFGEAGLILTSFNNSVEFQFSRNSRDTTDPYTIAYLDTVTPEEEKAVLGSTFKISHDNGVTFGPLYKSPVTSPHGPIELQDGTILWVGTTFHTAGQGSDLIEAHRIDPDGSMEHLGTVDGIYENGEELKSCEPYAFQLDDGTILCHIRTEPIHTTFQTKSTDGGRTWSPPKRLLPDHGGATVHLMQHSSGALIGVYQYRKSPCGIKAMFSYDGGETWDTDNAIYTNGLTWDLGYPSTVELKDGSLLTVFYAHPGKGMPAVIMQQKWTFGPLLTE